MAPLRLRDSVLKEPGCVSEDDWPVAVGPAIVLDIQPRLC
jgi:hypothetical protein